MAKSKRQTTAAKRDRERGLIERRLAKEARKAARKADREREAAEPPALEEEAVAEVGDDDES